ncbi:MAG: TetR/AcrR family transcriptional regulator [Chitinophagales bacterium]|nr:TetR/AcrR family transcriptional regulator [Chitinophagales bacterium]
MGRNSIAKKRTENPKKRLEIILGLIDFFKKNSLSTSNMDDIALALNRSKATLYKYFKSKEAMVEAVIHFKIDAISAFVLILNDEQIPFFQRYQKSFDLLQEHITDIPNEFMKDLKEVFPEIFLKIERLIEFASAQLAEYYEEGMRRGVFNNLNARILSQNDFVFFRMLTDADFLKEQNLSMKEAFKDFYEIRCNGLLANK